MITTLASDKLVDLVEIFKKSEEPTSIVHQSIVLVICLVPAGAVATYGQIAKLAGYPRHARQVVWALHSSSKKYKMPWHRIINSQGKIGHNDERSHLRQKRLLEKEGIEFDHLGRIDLDRFGWNPEAGLLRKYVKSLERKPTKYPVKRSFRAIEANS